MPWLEYISWQLIAAVTFAFNEYLRVEGHLHSPEVKTWTEALMGPIAQQQSSNIKTTLTLSVQN